MIKAKERKALKNKRKMKSGLAEYHALRRAYIDKHGEPPPKGTKKSDLEAMGLKKKKRKKRKAKSRTEKISSGSTVFNWKNAFWR